jgi:hypothetical protein
MDIHIIASESEKRRHHRLRFIIESGREVRRSRNGRLSLDA